MLHHAHYSHEIKAFLASCGSASLSKRASPEQLPLMAMRVKELREAKGLTLEALAAKAGLSKHTVVKVETGRRRNVTRRTLVGLARALQGQVHLPHR
jgi:DNA-binding XRE family transcriptional regulator